VGPANSVAHGLNREREKGIQRGTEGGLSELGGARPK
jgi:hypothetical protein